MLLSPVSESRFFQLLVFIWQKYIQVNTKRYMVATLHLTHFFCLHIQGIPKCHRQFFNRYTQ